MDSQKNDGPQATPADGEATPTSEINVEMDANAVGAPAVDSTVTAAADSAVSFTTDSDGTVQAVSSPDGISTPPLGSEGAEVPTGQQPGASVNPEASAQDAFSAPAPAADQSATDSAAPLPPTPDLNTQAPIAGVQPEPVDPTNPAAGIPAAAPVPVPAKDKKVLVILVIVAVVLLGAIAAMLLL